MRLPVSHLAGAALAAGLLLCPAGRASTPAGAPATRSWHFTALLDGRPIGWHDFTVSGDGATAEVTSHARFVVRVLHVPVYRYEHRDHERWRDGCLRWIDARTDDDGARLELRGTAAGDSLVLRSPQGERRLDGCVHTYAYWDPSLLAASALLDPGTGDLDAVTLDDLGMDSLVIEGRTVPARHRVLRGPGRRIELWYSPQGRWLALQTRTTQGRILRYELRQ